MSRSKHKVHLISENPGSPLSEAFRQLRTNIEYSGVDQDLQTITITSAGAGEGKSTASVNLAIAFAQAGKKVLLIDANLRNPAQHRIFQISNGAGITSVLSQQKTLKEVTLNTFFENLKLIPAGPAIASSAEILGSKRMLYLLEELKKEYDTIVIDTPPLLTNSDAQIISALSDGVMLVINSGKVKKEALFKAKVSLELVKAKILGAVLNNIEQKRINSYMYG